MALLGKSLLGKVRSPATGAEGLASRCLPLVMSKAFSLSQHRMPQLTGDRLGACFPGIGTFQAEQASDIELCSPCSHGSRSLSAL